MTSRAHLVGSVNLSNAEAVFRAVGEHVGDVAARIPDGETGERLGWARWQLGVLRRQPAFELAESVWQLGQERPRFRLRAGASTDDLDLDRLGYAEEAFASYATFTDLRERNVIPTGPRFLVALPTPSAVASAYLVPEHQAEVATAYERALIGEVVRIASEIPVDDLAIQWDAPGEVGQIVGAIPHYYPEGDLEDTAVNTLVRLCQGVPAEVELGVHLCHGDSGSQFTDLNDLSLLTRMMNAISERCTRPINYFHVPVPMRRDDESYFSPLTQLKLDPNTVLSLGLIHHEDGVEGALRRITTARAFIPDFDIATECGLGRQPSADILPLLALHRQVLTDPNFAYLAR